jgi:acetylornithine deacetylase
MIPSENEAHVIGELREIVDELATEDPTFRAEVRATLTRGGFEVAPDAPIVRTVLDQATAVLGHTPPTRGFGFWMDSAFLAQAGIETVVFGGIGEGAHADVEWADVESHVQIADILARSAVAYCG